MNDTVRFRAWHIEERVWYHFDYIDLLIGRVAKEVGNTLMLESHCRFTGLTTKKGEDIFEGDIISYGGKWRGMVCFEKFTIPNGDELDYVIGFCVKEIYRDGLAVFPSPLVWDEEMKYKILGNIYENKDLL